MVVLLTITLVVPGRMSRQARHRGRTPCLVNVVFGRHLHLQARKSRERPPGQVGNGLKLLLLLFDRDRVGENGEVERTVGCRGGRNDLGTVFERVRMIQQILITSSTCDGLGESTLT
jgi:hypothetical protein